MNSLLCFFINLGGTNPNYAHKKAIHLKCPVGEKPRILTDNINSAAKQFRNSAEPAPPGYKRIVKVRILNPIKQTLVKLR